MKCCLYFFLVGGMCGAYMECMWGVCGVCVVCTWGKPQNVGGSASAYQTDWKTPPGVTNTGTSCNYQGTGDLICEFSEGCDGAEIAATGMDHANIQLEAECHMGVWPFLLYRVTVHPSLFPPFLLL